METALSKTNSSPNFNLIRSDETPISNKIGMASIKASEKKPEEPKKNIWSSVFFGLATGLLSLFINILPEKIGQYISHVFASMVKAENPFIPEEE
jgi:hypothetical protein